MYTFTRKRIFLCCLVEQNPILETHNCIPRGAAFAVEYDRRSVLEPLGVPHRLLHPIGKPDLLCPLAFTVNIFHPLNIGLCAIVQGIAHLGGYAILSEKSGKFDFAPSAFPLAFRSYVLSLLFDLFTLEQKPQ